jgi:hypothetical protein
MLVCLSLLVLLSPPLPLAMTVATVALFSSVGWDGRSTSSFWVVAREKAPCLQQTPLFWACLVHPSALVAASAPFQFRAVLAITNPSLLGMLGAPLRVASCFTFAPCAMHSPPFWACLVHPLRLNHINSSLRQHVRYYKLLPFWPGWRTSRPHYFAFGQCAATCLVHLLTFLQCLPNGYTSTTLQILMTSHLCIVTFYHSRIATSYHAPTPSLQAPPNPSVGYVGTHKSPKKKP